MRHCACQKFESLEEDNVPERGWEGGCSLSKVRTYHFLYRSCLRTIICEVVVVSTHCE